LTTALGWRLPSWLLDRGPVVVLPAAAIVTLCLSAVTYVLVLVATFAFADGTPTPSLGLILQSAGWIALANVAVVALTPAATTR
jgi:hypothetical protein